MQKFLLDVNVLLALIDPVHMFHDAAHRWFQEEGQRGWATCPITELGVLRIAGAKHYPNSPGTPARVAASLLSLRAVPGHEFWADDFSLLDGTQVQTADLLRANQITDTYLLALAARHGGRLATFDRRITTVNVKDGPASLHQIAYS